MRFRDPCKKCLIKMKCTSTCEYKFNFAALITVIPEICLMLIITIIFVGIVWSAIIGKI